MELIKTSTAPKRQPAGRLREEADLRTAIRTARRTCGSEHVSVAFCHINLGDFYLREHNFMEAETAFRHAADIYDALGVGHELLHAIALRSLAQALCAQERDAEAAAVSDRANELILNYQ